MDKKEKTEMKTGFESSFRFQNTGIAGLTLVTPFYVEDERGFFLKSYEQNIFLQNGIRASITEDFETYSRQGVLRGLHFQTVNPQSKLVRAVEGTIFDVAVDLRKNSHTYGKWSGFYLSGDNHTGLFIPPGFAHGFLVLSEFALVNYKCTGAFEPEGDTGIRCDDPDIGIVWPLNPALPVILSEKDRNLQSFREFKAKDEKKTIDDLNESLEMSESMKKGGKGNGRRI